MALTRAARPVAPQLQLDLGVAAIAPAVESRSRVPARGEGQGRRFGSLVGELLERAVAVPLTTLGDELGLFVDHVHRDRACRGRFVSWIDPDGTEHRPDFVFERGGSDVVIGTPAAFLEVGWRTDPKHARDKVQSAESVLLGVGRGVLAPVLGCIVAGSYSRRALQVLRRRGIAVLEIDRADLAAALDAAGLPAAPARDGLGDAIDALERVSVEQVAAMAAALCSRGALAAHLAWLRRSLTRRLVRARLVELRGRGWEAAGVDALLASLGGPASPLGHEGWRVEVAFDDGSGGRLDVATREEAEALVRALA